VKPPWPDSLDGIAVTPEAGQATRPKGYRTGGVGNDRRDAERYESGKRKKGATTGDGVDNPTACRGEGDQEKFCRRHVILSYHRDLQFPSCGFAGNNTQEQTVTDHGWYIYTTNANGSAKAITSGDDD
jgi:hypothetical protein